MYTVSICLVDIPGSTMSSRFNGVHYQKYFALIEMSHKFSMGSHFSLLKVNDIEIGWVISIKMNKKHRLCLRCIEMI